MKYRHLCPRTVGTFRVAAIPLRALVGASLTQRRLCAPANSRFNLTRMEWAVLHPNPPPNEAEAEGPCRKVDRRLVDRTLVALGEAHPEFAHYPGRQLLLQAALNRSCSQYWRFGHEAAMICNPDRRHNLSFDEGRPRADLDGQPAGGGHAITCTKQGCNKRHRVEREEFGRRAER